MLSLNIFLKYHEGANLKTSVLIKLLILFWIPAGVYPEAAAEGPAFGMTEGGEPVVTNVEENQVTVELQTEALTRTSLYYGRDPKDLSLIVKSPLNNLHKIKLTELTPNTEYFFRVTTENEKGVKKAGPLASFKTKISLGKLLPQFTTAPSLKWSDNQTATLSWTASIPVTAEIFYGVDQNNLNLSKELILSDVSHEISFKDLTPQKTYYFKVVIRAGRSSVTSRTLVLSTKDLQKQKKPTVFLHPPVVSQVSYDSVLIEVELTQPAPLKIKYGKPKKLILIQESSENKNFHKIKIEGLKKDTKYDYEVYINNTVVPEIYTFRTNLF